MSNGGAVVIAYDEEAAWGTSDAVSFKKIAFATSESLGTTTSTATSDAIRGDYVKPNVIRTDISGGGAINFEAVYKDGPIQDFLEGALRSDWSTAAATSAQSTISAVDVASQFHRSAGSFVTDGWVVGMAGRSSGFSTAANNGYFVVIAVTTNNLDVTGINTATEAEGNAVTLVNTGYMMNGIAVKSYTLEKQFTDLTTCFIPMPGARVSSWSLSAQAGAICTGSVNFVGKAQLAIATATAGSGAYSASSGVANQPMNGIDNVTGIYVGNDDTLNTTPVTYCVSQIDLNINCPARPISCLGSLGPSAIGSNSFEITGSLRVYFDDTSKALWSDYIAYTEKALIFRLVDVSSNALVFFIPQVNITASDGPAAGGPDTDVMMNLSFTAEYDATIGGLMSVTRIDA